MQALIFIIRILTFLILIQVCIDEQPHSPVFHIRDHFNKHSEKVNVFTMFSYQQIFIILLHLLSRVFFIMSIQKKARSATTSILAKELPKEVQVIYLSSLILKCILQATSVQTFQCNLFMSKGPVSINYSDFRYKFSII